MRLHRYLKEDNIDLDFRPFETEPEWHPGHVHQHELDEDEDENVENQTPGQRFRKKVVILDHLVRLMENGGRISNPKKCLTDLRNREAKASTGLGLGMAMPHVRTPQAKDFSIGVAITPSPGLPFDAIDGEPVRIFFPMVAPRHKDRFYRKVERALAGAFADEDDMSFRDALLGAESPGEVICLMRERVEQA
jgi:mannitol/fructose-specific phosphotransferase system IIA component (Ntr-type)